MHGDERAGVLRESEGGAEGIVIGGAVQIGILDHRDGLALAGDSGGEDRAEVIDRGEIGGSNYLVSRAAVRIGESGPCLAHYARLEIVQGKDAGDSAAGICGSEMLPMWRSPRALR